MKKISKILTFALASLLFVACDDVLAKPNKVNNNDKLVTFNGDKDYFDNNFEVVYNKLVESGTSNSTILAELTKIIAKEEIKNFYNLTPEQLQDVFNHVADAYPAEPAESASELEKAIFDSVEKAMLAKVKSDTYAIDRLFQEEKLVNELRTSLYKVEGTSFTKDLLITPDMKVKDIIKGDYKDYIERAIFPDVYKELLTSVYIYNEENSAIGRAYARDVKYIKLDAIPNHVDSTSILVEAYLQAFVDGTLPTADFDLDSLARIYKGVYNSEDLANTSSVTYKEYQFAKTNNIFSKADTINEDLKKVVAFDTEGNPTDTFLGDYDKEKSVDLTNSYTGNYAHLPSWGKTLKEREIEQLDIVTDDGLVIRSGGVSELSDALRENLFTASVQNYIVTLNNKANTKSVNFLKPLSTPNGSQGDELISKYAHYDSASNAYYLIIVDGYYNTSSFKDGKNKDIAMNIARILGKTSSNQKDSLEHYLKKYDLTFGDQKFYDYIESTYPDILED